MNDKKQFKITYTAEEIHTALVLCALEYMKKWKVDVDEKELERNNMLKELGFTSSKSLSESNEKVKPTKMRKVFEWYETNFPGCIFLESESFVDILIKYNLTCGRLSSYTGEVPYENLVEIKEVHDKLKKVHRENIYSNIITESNTIQRPYKEYKNEAYIDGKLRYVSGIAAALMERNHKVEHKGYKLFYSYGGNDISKEEYEYLEERYKRFPFIEYENDTNPDELFIAAPLQDMQSDLNSEIVSKDPFVFQLFPYGVVIYSKWGDEANDPILKEKRL